MLLLDRDTPFRNLREMRKTGLIYLNGERREFSAKEGQMMLADYLRYVRQLTGTKIVCAEGDCGACTVLRWFPYSQAKNLFLPINSCIATLAQMDGSSLVTVDVLAAPKLTPVQTAMMDCHGSQCGFCTPGFVMALTGLVEKKICEKKSAISAKDAQNATTGNLCRCTGYQPIIDAATSINLQECESLRERFFSKAQERELRTQAAEPLLLESDDFVFFAPTNVKDAAKILAKNAEARLLGAATDLGVVHNKRKIRLRKLVSLHLVKELYEFKQSRGRIFVGARVTLSELRSLVKKSVPEFARFLDLFASPQIKNVATLVGNVSNASPIADTPPFLLAMDADVYLLSAKGKRKVALSDFFLGYRKTARKPGEVIVGIEFSAQSQDEKLALYKVSQRKDLDISAVNAAFRLGFDKNGKIKTARLAMGGVAATALRLRRAEAVFHGKALNPSLIPEVIAAVHSEISPIADLRGSAAFRRVIAENFVRRFVAECTQ